jgi:hypothetical protein
MLIKILNISTPETYAFQIKYFSRSHRMSDVNAYKETTPISPLAAVFSRTIHKTNINFNSVRDRKKHTNGPQ